jgi:serine O-acetyltransferase
MMDTVTVWKYIKKEAGEQIQSEPILASFLYNTILNHDTLESALSYHLANKLGNANLQPTSLMELFLKIFAAEPKIVNQVRDDLVAVVDRDPACSEYCIPLLYFKGFQALQSHRMSNWLWLQGRKPLALTLQNRISEVFVVDIHPGAKMGSGILMDHATGIVIGETAVVGDNVSILHEVTLGGTGKDVGDRHPKIGNGVLLGAGAKLLGNITIGECAKVGAGSVVLIDIPAHMTAAGVPAKITGHTTCKQPALEMNQWIECDKGAGV